MSVDASHASSLHDVADEISDYLEEALAAAREYRDRCLAIGNDDRHQDDDERYLAARKGKITLRMSDVANALYLLD
jgi:hypothetical protein